MADYPSQPVPSVECMALTACGSRGLSREHVTKAMLVCRRDAFVPEEQRQAEAFTDAPLPIQGMGFNMSAPHMHATCLEALMLEPGHRCTHDSMQVQARCLGSKICRRLRVSAMSGPSLYAWLRQVPGCGQRHRRADGLCSLSGGQGWRGCGRGHAQERSQVCGHLCPGAGAQQC